ncbi:MAG: hypothetical protein IJF67_15775 [Clostridia bacterium]|nr:hypothetical protein [Clostridia bacterium]
MTDKTILKTIRYCPAEALPPLPVTEPSAGAGRRIRAKVRKKLSPASPLAYPKMLAAVAVLLLCIVLTPLTLRLGGELGNAFILAGGDVVSELLALLPEDDELFPDGTGSLRYMGFRREENATWLQFRVETEPMENGALRCGSLTLRDTKGNTLTEMERFIINMTASTMLTSGAEGWSVGAVSGDAYVFELEAEPTLDEDAYLFLRIEDVLHYSTSAALEAFAGLLSIGFQVREYAAKAIETQPTEWGGYVQPLTLAGTASDGRNYTFTFYVETPGVRGVAAMCRSLTLTRSDGTPIKEYEWDLSDRERLGLQLMAADVLPGDVNRQAGRIMLQLTVPVSAVRQGEMLTLTIDELVTADMPGLETQITLYPVEDALELAFAVETAQSNDSVGSPESTEPLLLTRADYSERTAALTFYINHKSEAAADAMLYDRFTLSYGDVVVEDGRWPTDREDIELLMAGEVPDADVTTDGITFRLNVPLSDIMDKGEMTLTLYRPRLVRTRGTSIADGADVTEIAETLTCTFRTFIPEALTNAPSANTPPVIPTESPMSVTEVQRTTDGTVITARVEVDSLPGAYIVCDEVRVETANGDTLYWHTYGSGRTSRVETQAAAMVLAGDVLTVGKVGADAFEFQVKLPPKKTQDIQNLVLTLVNPTAVDTVDGIHSTVHPLGDSLACRFVLN